MVVLKIYVLVCVSREEFPNKTVFLKTVSVKSSNLQSMFFIMFRRVCLSLLWLLVLKMVRTICPKSCSNL